MAPSGKACSTYAERHFPPVLHNVVYAAVFAGILLLAGCASEGRLRPPSLWLPGPVHGISAEREGDTVVLRWTTPTRTTDGVLLTGKHGAGSLTADVCREEIPSTSACHGIARIAVSSGSTAQFTDFLPSPLITGGLRPLQYRVRILNGKGKGAEYTLAETLAGAAPPPVQGLRAAPVVSGVALQWQQDPAAAQLPTLIRVERGNGDPASLAGAKAPEPSRAILLAVEASGSDPGGAVDSGAKRGVSQTYTVVHTKNFDVNGKDLVISSTPVTVRLAGNVSAPAPAPPAGLEAVADTLEVPEVNLAWQPSGGSAAYNVYRGEGTGTMTLLTRTPLRSLTYTDTNVWPGTVYRYSVSAIDTQGTESSRSSEITSSVPRP